MSETTFLRLLKEQDKAEALLAAIGSIRAETGRAAHRVLQETFRMIPGSPFAYWVSDALRRKFTEFRPLEGNFATLRVGLQTSDDFRFVRASWEVLPERVGQSMADALAGRLWVAFAKGGEYSPYYADIHLVVNWNCQGVEIRAFETAYIRNEQFYFRVGLTWPARTTSGLSVRVMPGGCIFAHKGPALFTTTSQDLFFMLAVTNSQIFQVFVSLALGAGDAAARSYEVGVLQNVPLPEGEQIIRGKLSKMAAEIHSLKRSLDTAMETSHAFITPALLQRLATTLKERLANWNAYAAASARQIESAQRDIDELCYRLYEITPADRAAIEVELGNAVRSLPELLAPDRGAADLLSWMVGVAIGRFDVRLALGARPIPELGDPFTPLPPHSLGMLSDDEEPSDYPLKVAEDGILVEDEGHDEDIVNRIQEVFHLLWGNRAEAIEREALAMLGAKSLREYLSRAGKGSFWETHVARYSKSRRTAPIYWLLQSARGSYSVWLYCHRLSGDTLHKLLGVRYLGGRIQRVRHEIQDLRPKGEKKTGISLKARIICCESGVKIERKRPPMHKLECVTARL